MNAVCASQKQRKRFSSVQKEVNVDKLWEFNTLELHQDGGVC
jgi:hypothetical protein